MFKDNRRFLFLYSGLFGLAWLCGFRPEVPYKYIQLLDPAWLRERFWESIWNLHYQPPGLNFLLGVFLWLKDLTGIKAEALITAVHFCLGLVITAAVASLARSLIKDRLVSSIVITLFLLNPYLYQSALLFFYTYYELLFLSLLGVLVHRYLREPRVGAYACICLLLICQVYMHSLFHFLWPLPVLAGLPFLRRRHPALAGRNLKITLLLAGATLVVLLAWPLKNYARFGYFTYSSLQGINLTTKPVDIPIHVPPEFGDIPALARNKKSDGTLNWNNYSMIAASKEIQSLFIQAVKESPGLVFDRALFFYLKGFTVFEARSTWTGRLYTNTPAIRLWMRAYEITFFQHFGEFNVEEFGLGWGIVFTGFAFLFPAIIFSAGYRVFRSWKTMPSESGAAAFMLYCVLWVLLMSLLVNGYESNRYRFPTEPFIFILAGWAVSALSSPRAKAAVLAAAVLFCAALGAANRALFG